MLVTIRPLRIRGSSAHERHLPRSAGRPPGDAMTWCYHPETDSPSAQEAVDWIWASCLPSQSSTPDVLSNGNSARATPLSPLSAPDTSPLHQSGMTSQHSTPSPSPEQSTPCLQDTHASHSARPDSAKEKTTSGTCGQTSSGSSESLDQPCAGAFSRTSPDILASASTPCCVPYETWVSQLRLAYSQRKKSARRMKGSAFSSWPIAKALTGGANSNRDARGAGGPDLQEAAQNWPTPACRDHKGENSAAHLDNGTGRKHLDQLPNFVAHSFSRPDQATATSGLPSFEARRLSLLLYRSVILKPPRSISRPYCPPTRRDPSNPARSAFRRKTSYERWSEKRRKWWQSRRLSPSFVGWLMGWPPGHALCDCSETEWSRWQQHMRGELSQLPTASAGWIWKEPMAAIETQGELF